jgi:Ser/Thr protein kinase RdoA (MazF antagonist)
VQAAALLAARHWGLPDPVLIRTGMNALFAAGDEVVLRVGCPSADPGAAVWLAEWLAGHGLRVPRFVRPDAVVSGERAVFAVAREHEHGQVDWSEVGSIVARLHTLDPAEVAGRYPTPWCGSFPWWDFAALLSDVGPTLDERARAGIERALERHGGWAAQVERPVLCHGDVHPGNVVQTETGPVLLDWDLLCTGPAAWDHAPLMTWTERWGGSSGIYEAFAAGYGGSMRGDRVAEALAELRLLAATLMRVRAARTDPAAAEEAERRLTYWRGDPDAPTWRAV